MLYNNSSRPDEPAEDGPDETQACTITARVLGGNPDKVGPTGGLTGDTVGRFPVTTGSAAVDPLQWGGKGILRQYGSQVSGQTASGQSFQGLTDVIGSQEVSNVRDRLKDLNPGAILLELVNGKDEGVTTVTLRLPKGMQCPQA